MLKLSVEDALTWTYCDELPKAGAAGRLKGPRMATPGWVKAAETWAARIDISNAYGLMPDLGATASPHPAAIALHELLGCLDDVAFAVERMEVFDDWMVDAGTNEQALLQEVAGAARARALIRLQEGALRPRGDLAERLRRCALLGPPTGWKRAPRPELKLVLSKQGQCKWFRMVRQPVRFDKQGRPVAFVDVETDDGWSPSAKGPVKGAYRKTCLVPDPSALADDRLEWIIWRLLLDVVAEMASEARFTFEGHERVTIEEMGLAVMRSSLPNHPWMSGDGEVIRTRVLPVDAGTKSEKPLRSKGFGGKRDVANVPLTASLS